MSRHSKNCTSQSIFTYGQRKKLKGEYGVKEQRIGQDSIRRFEMCTLCSHRVVEPMTCDHGHIFCRACVIEYLVIQKKKNHTLNQSVEKQQKIRQQQQELKKLEKQTSRIVDFQKYDNFEDIAKRNLKGEVKATPLQIKPTGIYEHNLLKDEYVKSSFWAIENTPHIESKSEKVKANKVKCPAGNHYITHKKLRDVIVKDVQGEFCCGICSKEIGRQKVGAYSCGHLICRKCKSEKCEICGKKEGWLDIESNKSAFVEHNNAEVKVYTHAFYQ